ncbi:MAG: flagellar basal body-associated FliL family protein [Armatimonadetes bacterium]|nr:flagellar basal body-associated FliL family protein [Armatimonadota bacterium]
MSEAKEDAAPKKKGGKMPIILALVLMLGGGGFFMMKKGGKHEKPKIKLAKEEILLDDEFIVNMADNRTYVRAKIGLKAKDGFKAEEIVSHSAEVSDAINSILRTTKPEQIVTEEQIHTLKVRIATALNKIFKASEEDATDEESDSKDDKKKKKSSDDEQTDDKSSKSKKDSKDEEDTSSDPEELPDGWDSAKGPILKVFFKALATQ